VGYDLRAGFEREHSIEGRNAMNFSRSNVQTQRDVVQGAGADPADAVLDRMERGEKTMSLATAVVVESCPRIRGLPLAALPARSGHAQFRVNRGALFRCRLRVG
jgi:hypothetical protein